MNIGYIMNDSYYDDYSFIYASRYRPKILETLLREPRTPSEISRITGISMGIVTKILMEFRKRGLIECITPDRKKGRIYTLTKRGRDLFSKKYQFFGAGKPLVISSLMRSKLKLETPLLRMMLMNDTELREDIMKIFENLFLRTLEKTRLFENELVNRFAKLVEGSGIKVERKTRITDRYPFLVDLLLENPKGKKIAVECIATPLTYDFWKEMLIRSAVYLHFLNLKKLVDYAYLATYDYLINKTDIDPLANFLKELDIGLIMMNKKGSISKIIPRSKRELWNKLICSTPKTRSARKK